VTSPVTLFALNGRSSAFRQEIKARATGVDLLGHCQLEAEEIDSEAEDEEAVPVEVIAAAARASAAKDEASRKSFCCRSEPQLQVEGAKNPAKCTGRSRSFEMPVGCLFRKLSGR
jgi:hypothetical protein